MPGTRRSRIRVGFLSASSPRVRAVKPAPGDVPKVIRPRAKIAPDAVSAKVKRKKAQTGRTELLFGERRPVRADEPLGTVRGPKPRSGISRFFLIVYSRADSMIDLQL